MENNSADINLGENLKKFYTKMRIVHIFFHPFRNNPRNTKKFHYGFISAITKEKWEQLSVEFRKEWNSAASNFDKQFGLIRGLLGVSEAAFKCLWSGKKVKNFAIDKNLTLSLLLPNGQ